MALKQMLLAVSLSLIGLSVIADQPMVYIHHAPESPLDRRYVYQWEILRTALDKTKEKYGPFEIKQSEFMTERRQTEELRAASGRLTVMYLSTTADLEANLIPIRIPVDKNLGGYNIFLIRKETQARIAAVRNLDDLRKFTFGLGLGWLDVAILNASDFKVVTGSSYEGLFEMLVNKRFDIFLRGAVEITDEYDARKEKFPDMQIEDSIALYYPLPMYFWFSKTEEGRRLANRAEEGLWTMINDGTFNQIFDKYQRDKILRLKLKDRRVFKIENPLLGHEARLNDKRLWFDPATYR